MDENEVFPTKILEKPGFYYKYLVIRHPIEWPYVNLSKEHLSAGFSYTYTKDTKLIKNDPEFQVIEFIGIQQPRYYRSYRWKKLLSEDFFRDENGSFYNSVRCEDDRREYRGGDCAIHGIVYDERKLLRLYIDEKLHQMAPIKGAE